MQLLDILNAIARKNQIANDWNYVDLKNQTVKNKLTEFFGDLTNDVPISAASGENESQIAHLQQEIQNLGVDRNKCHELIDLINSANSQERVPIYKRKDIITISWGPKNQLAYETFNEYLRIKENYDSQTHSWQDSPFEVRTDPVYAVAFDPNGALVASGNKIGRLKIWNVKTATNIYTVPTGAQPIVSLSWGSGTTIAVAKDNDSRFYVYDYITSSYDNKEFTGHTDKVNCLAYSPDKTKIASGSDDFTVRVWNAENARLLLKLNVGKQSPSHSVAWNPSGTRIVSGLGEYKQNEFSHNWVCVWNAQTEEAQTQDAQTEEAQTQDAQTQNVVTRYPVHNLTGHFKRVTSVAWSPNNLIVSGSEDDRCVRIWATNRKEWYNFYTDQFSKSLLCLSVSNQSVLAIGVGDELVVRDLVEILA